MYIAPVGLQVIYLKWREKRILVLYHTTDVMGHVNHLINERVADLIGRAPIQFSQKVCT